LKGSYSNLYFKVLIQINFLKKPIASIYYKTKIIKLNVCNALTPTIVAVGFANIILIYLFFQKLFNIKIYRQIYKDKFIDY